MSHEGRLPSYPGLPSEKNHAWDIGKIKGTGIQGLKRVLKDGYGVVPGW